MTSGEPVGQSPEPGPRPRGDGVVVSLFPQIGRLAAWASASKLILVEPGSLRQRRSAWPPQKQRQKGDFVSSRQKPLRHLESHESAEAIAADEVWALGLDRADLLKIIRGHRLDGEMGRLSRDSTCVRLATNISLRRSCCRRECGESLEKFGESLEWRAGNAGPGSQIVMPDLRIAPVSSAAKRATRPRARRSRGAPRGGQRSAPRPRRSAGRTRRSPALRGRLPALAAERYSKP